MGYAYDFKKENYHRHHALICTNTDNIEHCEELIRKFPGMHFHIAAVTLMSLKLMDLEKYDNVSLYLGVQAKKLDELFQLSDYYFDINHWTEIVSAVYRTFLHNQLIFASEETVHNRTYVVDAHVYPIAECDRMVSDVREFMEDKEIMERHLEQQRRDAMMENEETLKAVCQFHC